MYGYLVKRYRNGRELAEGVRIVAENDAEAIERAKAMYNASDNVLTEFRVANCYEISEDSISG